MRPQEASLPPPQRPLLLSFHRLTGKRELIIGDSLFSVDGYHVDLQSLVFCEARHDFALMLDEAHATLVCGERCDLSLGRVITTMQA